MKGQKPNSPFKITPQSFGSKSQSDAFDADAWLEAIKAEARANLDNFWERARIEWTAKFKKPKYDSFHLYSREELLCELWEQYYLENPDSLDLKGFHKKKDPNTGYTYYVTGDPVIDGLERSFAAGIIPDMNAAFRHTEAVAAKPIWEEPVFETMDGAKVAAHGRFDRMVKADDGHLVTAAGTSARSTDFTSDGWLDAALEDDPVLKAMKDKFGG